QAKWLTRRTTTKGTNVGNSGNISNWSVTTTATAERYVSIKGGSATTWSAINASSAVATSTDVSIAVMAGAGVGGAVTVGSSIRNIYRRSEGIWRAGPDNPGWLAIFF